MYDKLKQELKKVHEKCLNADICKEKPSFACIVFAYKALTEEISRLIDLYEVKEENIEWFLTEEMPISRVTFSLEHLGIIDNISEDYPYWINYVGDFVAEEFIKESKNEY